MIKMENNVKVVDFILKNDECIGCAICADVCLEDAIEVNEVDFYPLWDKKKCVGCRECEEQCPTEAIKVFVMKL